MGRQVNIVTYQPIPSSSIVVLRVVISEDKQILPYLLSKLKQEQRINGSYEHCLV